MVGIGTSALYSIERGAGNHRRAQKILGNAFVLLPLLSVVLGALMYRYSI